MKTEEYIEMIKRTINHFRAYQYGEPYEGKIMAMRHAFDIWEDDAKVILLGLETMADLLRLSDSLETATNFRARDKAVSDITDKMKKCLWTEKSRASSPEKN
jgi:hypothetical protein